MKNQHIGIMGTIRDKEQEMIAQQALALLDKEHHLGKYQYPTRQDIHDRESCTD